jgi:hypothetical protein
VHQQDDDSVKITLLPDEVLPVVFLLTTDYYRLWLFPTFCGARQCFFSRGQVDGRGISSFSFRVRPAVASSSRYHWFEPEANQVLRVNYFPQKPPYRDSASAGSVSFHGLQTTIAHNVPITETGSYISCPIRFRNAHSTNCLSAFLARRTLRHLQAGISTSVNMRVKRRRQIHHLSVPDQCPHSSRTRELSRNRSWTTFIQSARARRPPPTI